MFICQEIEYMGHMVTEDKCENCRVVRRREDAVDQLKEKLTSAPVLAYQLLTGHALLPETNVTRNHT